ncbi:MAG: citrate synthase, partial [Candidatus Omnitrophica bacterium]|nr:citrate synthase [Candidatus Omnitrophota bacterium]
MGAVQKGLEGVVASDTRLSDVDGAKCQLIYRGYEIGELVGRATYEEVSHLLLFGRLPTRTELQEWTGRLASRRALDPAALQLMPQLPFNNPMAYLRTVMSFMGLSDPEAEDLSPAALRERAVELIAKTPTIVATFDRLRRKRPMLGPNPALGHAANVLFMLHGEDPAPQAAQALDAYFVLLAEHGFNASTFAARTTVATQSDCYSGIVAAIGTLKGPLHGAANTKAMEMLMEIGSADQVEPYVQKTLADHKRFMGFGHRVYKGEDPRAKHLKHYAQQLADLTGERRWFEVSGRLQEAVWQAKKLSINVDFYSASLLYSLKIPVDLFTPMFACARMAGWSAHILEQLADNRLIRPLAQYVGPRDLKFVPIEQRS